MIHPPSVTDDAGTTTTRRGRRRWRIAAAGAIGAIALSMAACTPSGLKAEQIVTARVDQVLRGTSGNPANVDCGDFEISGGSFNGICSVNGYAYAVTSTYANNNTTASIDVGRWTGEGGRCAVGKATNGNWVIFQWAGSEVCTYR